MFEPTHTLEDLVPEAREMVSKLVAAAASKGFQVSIGKNGVGRTCATQAKLAAGGASMAPLCRSWHVLGRAVDLDLQPNVCSVYTELGELWESWGGTWGGRWKQFGECGDARHYQWTHGVQAVPESVCPSDLTLDECKALRQSLLAKEFGKSPLFWLALAAGVGVVSYAAWRYSRGR